MSCTISARHSWAGRRLRTRAGLHVHAVQKLARTYEHIDPSLVGNRQNIVISDMSGQSNILAKAAALGFDLKKGSPEVNEILQPGETTRERRLRIRGGGGSLSLLIRKVLRHHRPMWDLLEYHTHLPPFRRRACNTCEATVKLRVNERA